MRLGKVVEESHSRLTGCDSETRVQFLFGPSTSPPSAKTIRLRPSEHGRTFCRREIGWEVRVNREFEDEFLASQMCTDSR